MINQPKLKKFAIESRKKLIRITGDKIDQLIALGDDKAAAKGIQSQYNSLQAKLKEVGKQQLAEQVAYVWFNRFIALRFMDANDYNHPKILTPSSGQSSVPQILNDAINGIVSSDLKLTRQDVLMTLSDSSGGKDPQGLAYRQLLIASCNKLSSDMPDMFERISDYTELLLPDDLLSVHSIISEIRDSITDDDCKDVEIIGWLYQYYISERKDEVFAGFKKNKKAEAKDIPAATQLFTPHWIVRYLVENSLGRLWMLNNPNSKLPEKMPYYIAPETPETDFLRIPSPTEIKICDPACGSGHMLTYAFDLLYEIYNEAGYSPTEIPTLILQNNLYGIEIDQRAGSLASFALVMKAKFYNKQVDISKLQPHICVLQNIRFSDQEIKDYVSAAGANLFTKQLQSNMNAFAEADNFGSLITTGISNPKEIIEELGAINLQGNLLLSHAHKNVLRVLEQSDYLRQKYHVVVANPPYMGSRNMNTQLSRWLKDNYNGVKSDLFSAFVMRCGNLGVDGGHIGIMSPNVWMYISSYEKLRVSIISSKMITNLVELPLTGFKGATVQICAYNFVNAINPIYKGTYTRLVDFKGGDIEMSQYTRRAIENNDCEWSFKTPSTSFTRIPGIPIAYWTSAKLREEFDNPKLEDHATLFQGIITGDNEKFVRYWYELSLNKLTLSATDISSVNLKEQYWVPYNKGGASRRWYGNQEMVVNFKNKGRDFTRGKHQFYDYFFKQCFSWTYISSTLLATRFFPPPGG